MEKCLYCSKENGEDVQFLFDRNGYGFGDDVDWDMPADRHAYAYLDMTRSEGAYLVFGGGGESGYVEGSGEILINYCPICGRDLRKK